MIDKHRKSVFVPQMSLSLSGVSPQDAKRIAADLPQAIQSALAHPTAASNRPLTQTDARPAAVTARLAGEIAGRIQARMSDKLKGGAS